MNNIETPRIWIGSLTDYNMGRLVGKWFDLTAYDSGEELQEAIYEMLKELNEQDGMEREEWDIHDYEYVPKRLQRTGSLNDLVEYSKLYEEHGEPFRVFIEEYLNSSDNMTDQETAFEDAFIGEYESMEAYAEQCVDEGFYGEVPETITSYIDYEKIARDLEQDHTFAEGYVFRSY